MANSAIDIGSVSQDMTLLSTATASSSSSVDFTLDSGYRDYLVTFGAVTPATDGAEFRLRTSTDGGSTFDSGATDYQRVLVRTAYSSGSSFSSNSTGDSEIMLTLSTGNGTNETINGWLRVHSPASTKYTHITCDLSHVVTDATGEFSRCAGFRASAADVDAIRFLFSSGNISVGEFRLYGLSDS